MIRNQIHCFTLPMRRNKRARLHVHDHHEFFCCLAGTGFQHTLAGTVTMSADDSFLFPSGQLHIGSGDRNCEGFVLSIDENLFVKEDPGDRIAIDILHAIGEKMRAQDNRLVFKAADKAHLRKRFIAIHSCFSEKTPTWRLRIKILIADMLAWLCEVMQCEIRHPQERDEVAERVLRMLNSYYMEPLNVRTVAEAADMGRSRFHHWFRDLTGTTLVDYLTKRRVEAAKRLLTEGKRAVHVVAQEAGFGSTSQFHDRFKASVGMSPAQWRKQHLSN